MQYFNWFTFYLRWYNNPATMTGGTHIFFEDRRNPNWHTFRLDLNSFTFEQQRTASQAELQNQNNEKRMKLLYHQFCIYANIQESDEEYDTFAMVIAKEIMTLMYTPITYWIKVPVVIEKKVDPEISEAIHITNEAMKAQKEIVEKISYINKLRNDYYTKYWTLIEKTMAYLQLK